MTFHIVPVVGNYRRFEAVHRPDAYESERFSARLRDGHGIGNSRPLLAAADYNPLDHQRLKIPAR